jgi:molecular chaperone GrpE
VSGTARNSAGGGKSTPAEDIDEVQPSVVIRDKRKVRRDAPADKAADLSEAGTRQAADASPSGPAGPATPPDEPEGPDAVVTDGEAVVVGEIVDEAEAEPEVADGGTAGEADVDEAIVIAEEDGVTATGVLGAELAALRGELDERTRDLQRVSAEYANYRKRVDRDRALVGEQATGSVLAALLPVLDDLDRAREHGDLVGPFGTVADQLTAALGKFGLTPFGEKGDPFDPTRHEAVAHLTSAEVTEPTCVDILRRGYQLGERLLRPALVAVADPE